MIVVITGASAGVGRATAEEFARAGHDIALLARDPDRLDSAAADIRGHGVRALAVPTDVADPQAVEHAAAAVERELGPIDIWVNVAMATIFAPVSAMTPAEFDRVTRVTYLGQVHGTMAALRHMRPRAHGSIVHVGSALAYRSIPLQSAYCGAKAAIRGFVDSLRSELFHDGVDIQVSLVELPAMNTPQFEWALTRLPRRAQPVPPIFQPEVAARAIVYAATHRRREIWLGWPTVKAILGNWVAPGLLDRYLAHFGYSGQMTQEQEPADAPANLFNPVPGAYGAHGRFDNCAKPATAMMVSDLHRTAFTAGVVFSIAYTAAGLLGLRRPQTGDWRSMRRRTAHSLE